MDGTENLTETRSSIDPNFIISDEVLHYVETVFSATSSAVISVFGSCANIINIIVFMKQGFTESINISFLALATADLCSLIATFFEAMCFNPYLNSEALNIYYRYFGIVFHGLFARIAWWIKTFITFERCLCIAMPFKIRRLVTPFRTAVIHLSITIFITTGLSPFFILNPLYDPRVNITTIAVYIIENVAILDRAGFSFNIASQLAPLFLEIVSTSVMVYQLQSKSKWRSAVVSSKNVQEGLTLRDRKLVKLVTILSVTFIAFTTPSGVNSVATVIFVKTYYFVGDYKNLYLTTWSIILTLEAINCSISIFIYYSMSSKFKNIFMEIFIKKKVSTKKKSTTNFKKTKQNIESSKRRHKNK